MCRKFSINGTIYYFSKFSINGTIYYFLLIDRISNWVKLLNSFLVVKILFFPPSSSPPSSPSHFFHFFFLWQCVFLVVFTVQELTQYTKLSRNSYICLPRPLSNWECSVFWVDLFLGKSQSQDIFGKNK